jgi:hypothetical protein
MKRKKKKDQSWIKKKVLEDKAKALLALQKESYLKAELQTLLQWRLGPEIIPNTQRKEFKISKHTVDLTFN